MNSFTLLQGNLKRFIRAACQLTHWISSGTPNPPPAFVKRNLLLSLTNADTVVVETGTYRGDTTSKLALVAKEIHTIEASYPLYCTATRTLAAYANIMIYHGNSRDVLPRLVPLFAGNNRVLFWLDAHYSGGVTYGQQDECPLLDELTIIFENLSENKDIMILIDDIRVFGVNPNYPSKASIIQLAANRGFSWDIVFDVMILAKGC